MTLSITDSQHNNTICIMLNVAFFIVMMSVVMLNFNLLHVIMLNVIMLSVVMLNVIRLSVDMLNVIMLSVIMLNVVRLSVVVPFGVSLVRILYQNLFFQNETRSYRHFAPLTITNSIKLFKCSANLWPIKLERLLI
jgi:hypothetical protein